ncbi:uncharacterized protein J8A68_000368 [[Candida] subhashii]|uniref:Ribosomal RNA-processing protein 43 n=1 Tax=[Candida] subhashii TaxID=561895 RepID=A0A8J5QWP8_9ASCO|nr:uncharacterized protein J8A68_000368 [[Candida] subhashii]KAG7666112.1 hypothetical protein J8A68_000368 [[Candida] subhashii]
MADLKQVLFTPDVLSRIAPDVALQRHLSIGIRPNLRNFLEFNPIEIAQTNQLTDNNNNIFTSSIIKSGSTTIINTITLGVVEDFQEDHEGRYSSVYPVVEVLRGRLGAPTDEEMVLAQNLYETLYHSKIIPSESLKIKNYGIAVKQEGGDETIYYPDLNKEEWEYINTSSTHSKSYSFVLSSSIKIYSKTTSINSLFDLCYLSMIDALKKLRLPRIYLSDSLQTKISMKSRRSNTRGLININRRNNNLNIDLHQDLYCDIKLNNVNEISSNNFGVIKDENNNVIMLADLEGEVEEVSILSRLSIITNKNGIINKISLINGDDGNDNNDCYFNLDLLRDAIEISKKRSSEGIV